TGLRNSPPENSRAGRAHDLRENCSARALENAAAEILQIVPKVSRLSHREKKSLRDNDMCLAEGVGFEPTLRFPVYTGSKRAPAATRPSRRRDATVQECAHYSRGRRGGNPLAAHRPLSSPAARCQPR